MIEIPVASSLLSVVTTTASVPVDVHVSGRTNKDARVGKNTNITGVATTTVTPSFVDAWVIESINVKNTHASLAQVVTVNHNDGAATAQLISVTLAAGETANYETGFGWRILDSNGLVKSSVNGLITVKTLSADHTDSSGAPTISNLQSGTLQAGTYQFQAYCVYQSGATTTGVNLSADFTGTVTTFVANGRFVDVNVTTLTGAASQAIASPGGTVSAVTSRAKSQAGMGVTISVDTINADCLYILEGTMVVTVAGSLNIWHGSEVAALSTLRAGSNMVVTKVG